ncbi:Uncharacterised protein [Vibrio cholerae]|nr:Uncharacterised protein [Vibrio cholerae]
MLSLLLNPQICQFWEQSILEHNHYYHLQPLQSEHGIR